MEVQRRVNVQLTRAIALFDRDARAREELRRALEGAGYRVDSFGEHRALLRALRARRYDVLVADLFSRSGRRLREQLRGGADAATIVAIVHDAPLQSVLRVMADLASDFVHVADPADESVGVVRRALAAADLRRKLRAFELSGGVQNSARYARVRGHVAAALADLRRAKQTLRARARDRKASA